MIKYLGFTIIVPLAASQTLHAQTKEPPGVPYFKIEGDADKVAPAFNWWFELNPQPEYDRWWHEIAACEKLPLPDTYKKVRWFAINAKVFAPPNEKGDTTEILPTAVAYTWRWGPELWLTLPLLHLEWLVKHEMLHLLMFWAGELPGHPPERFEICGLRIFYDPGMRVVYTR
jgi:hypothetical protein